MGKKVFIAIAFALILILLIAGMQAVKVAKANPIPWFANPQMKVTIQSPVSGATCALPLLVSFTAQGDSQFSVSDNVTQNWVRSFFYVLDGQNMGHSGLRFEGTKTTEIYGDPVYWYNFSGQAELTNLADGPHNITVYFGAVNSIGLVGTPSESIDYNPIWSATAQFYVNSTLPSPTQTPSPTPYPSPVLDAGNWVEVARFQGNTSLSNTTETFACNCTEWRIRWQFNPAHGYLPEMYTFSVTTYSQEKTSNYYIDQISEMANGNLTGSHIISNYEGTFSMAIITGFIKNYTVTVEQNQDEIPSATPKPTSTPTPSPSPTFASAPTPTQSPSPSPSPTQQPTTEPSPAASPPPTGHPSYTLEIMGTLVIVVVVVGSLVYFSKRRGKTND